MYSPAMAPKINAKGAPTGAPLMNRVCGPRLAEVLVHQAGHLEHRDLVALEDGTEVLVGVDHAAVLLVLQTLPLDVRPELLGDFRAGHRAAADHFGELVAGIHRLHERRIRLALRGLLGGLARRLSGGLLRCFLRALLAGLLRALLGCHRESP